MPHLTVNGARLYYEEAGSGPATLVFIHGLMLASESYDEQARALQSRFRVIRFDLRGQGRSEKTRQGLDLDQLAADTAALIEALSSGPVHLVGFSMGSFVALRVAALRPRLLRSLTLIGVSAEAEDADKLGRYLRLIRWVRLIGPRPFIAPMLKILFGDTFMNAPDRRGDLARWRRRLADLPRSIAHAALASAMRRPIGDALGAIRTPTLVVSGAEDRPIHPAHSRHVAASIPGARFVSFERTGHAVMIERPAAFNHLLEQFIDATSRSALPHAPCNRVFFPAQATLELAA